MEYTFKTPLIEDKQSTLLWHFRILVPNEYALTLIKPDRRVICTLNSTLTIHCALMPNGDGDFFIMINKENRKKLNIVANNLIEVELKKDTSDYGVEVPEVFTELCYQDPEGDKIFHSLTKGKQRSLLYLMGKPKSEQKKLEKTLVIFDYLKSTNGELDYKALNEAFKNNRFKL